ncbi:MAG: extracellular solute-binding protein [Chloroflexi bacterium]|nr:extracellular solute-binding protein [Chloroflexota bacterium]
MLAACGWRGAEAPAPGAALKQPVTLVVNQTSARNEGPFYEQIYKAAEARLPGLKTEGVIADPAKAKAMAAGGTPLDVIRLSGSRDTTDFACGGFLLPLNDFLKRGEFPTKDTMPIAIQGAEWRGKLYGITFNVGGHVIYFNQTLFERKGAKLPTDLLRERRWNWDTFREAARLVAGNTGPDRTWGLDRITCLCVVNSMIYSAGGEMYDKDITVSRFDHLKTIEAIQFLNDLVVRLKATPSPSERAELSAEPFMLGRSGMISTARFNARPIRENSEKAGWKPGMVLPPTGPSGKLVTRESPVSMGVGRETKHPEAAWVVVRTWGDPVGQKIYVENGLGLPTLKSMWDAPFVKDTLFPWEDLATYKRSIELAHIQVPPVYPQVASVWNREQNLMDEGQKSVRDGMLTLKREADLLLAETKCSA